MPRRPTSRKSSVREKASLLIQNSTPISDVLKAVKDDWKLLKFVPDKWKKNFDIVMAAVKENGKALRYASYHLRNNREVVIAAIRSRPHENVYKYVSRALRDDLEILKIALENGISEVGYFLASSRLQKHDDICLIAASRLRDFLSFAPQTARSNREIVLAAVTHSGRSLQWVSGQLLADRDITLAAVRSDGIALMYADDQWKNDKEIVLTAVRNMGFILFYASDALRGDAEVILAAVQNSGRALIYAVVDTLQDSTYKEIALAAVNTSGSALNYVADRFKDREIVLRAVEQQGNALEYAPKIMKGDHEIVRKAVEEDGYALRFASQEMKENPAIVGAAVRQSLDSYVFAESSACEDADVLATLFASYAYSDSIRTFLKHLARKRYDIYETQHVNFKLYTFLAPAKENRIPMLAVLNASISALKQMHIDYYENLFYFIHTFFVYLERDQIASLTRVTTRAHSYHIPLDVSRLYSKTNIAKFIQDVVIPLRLGAFENESSFVELTQNGPKQKFLRHNSEMDPSSIDDVYTSIVNRHMEIISHLDLSDEKVHAIVKNPMHSGSNDERAERAENLVNAMLGFASR